MVTRHIANSWETEAEKGRTILKNSVQQQWLLSQDKLPSLDRFNVLGVAEESGILSQKELEITASDATKLVHQMSIGAWSAEEVTIAFLKRATIGQQLVSLIYSLQLQEK